jgi:hypothetical protein
MGQFPGPLAKWTGCVNLSCIRLSPALSGSRRRLSFRPLSELRLELAESWRQLCQRPRLRKKQTRASLPHAWKREEDEMLERLTLREVARLTGRTITAVRKRRRILGLPDARFTEVRASRVTSLADQVADVRQRFAANFAALKASLQKLEAACAHAKTKKGFWQTTKRQFSQQTVNARK